MNRLLIFITGISLCSCATVSHPLRADKWLMLGEGGGFTGYYEYYFLIPNGQVFQQAGRDTAYYPMNHIPRKEARRCFRQISAMERAADEFENVSDNITKTMAWHLKDTTRQIYWFKETPGSKPADSLYRRVLAAIRLANPETSPR